MADESEIRYVFLGFPQRPDSPSPPAIPTIQLEPFLTLDGDNANVTMMRLTSHTGTHLDVPRHVFTNGRTVTDYEAADFIFHRPAIIDLPLNDCEVVESAQLARFVNGAKNADILLFRFGYGPVRRSDPARYSTRAPGFGVESAQFLRDHFPKLRAVGMDVPSLSCIEHLEDTFQAHHVLLAEGAQESTTRRFIIIEDLNLEQELHGLTTVIVAPLLVDSLDGSPCNVIGVVEG